LTFELAQGGKVLGFGAVGKMLILLGIFIILIGLFFLVGDRIPWLGRLPGDFIIRKKNFTFYFPLATSILISIILTLLFTFLSRK
jgi:Zn-dependent protease with chaperone function